MTKSRSFKENSININSDITQPGHQITKLHHFPFICVCSFRHLCFPCGSLNLNIHSIVPGVLRESMQTGDESLLIMCSFFPNNSYSDTQSNVQQMLQLLFNKCWKVYYVMLDSEICCSTWWKLLNKNRAWLCSVQQVATCWTASTNHLRVWCHMALSWLAKNSWSHLAEMSPRSQNLGSQNFPRVFGGVWCHMARSWLAKNSWSHLAEMSRRSQNLGSQNFPRVFGH